MDPLTYWKTVDRIDAIASGRLVHGEDVLGRDNRLYIVNGG
jgi:hypothetical protein